MKNIFNLVKKELFIFPLFKKQFILMSILFIIYALFIPQAMPMTSFIVLYLLCCMPLYYDELNNSNYLTYSLPISKTDYVIAKYLVNLLNLFISLLIVALTFLIYHFVGRSMNTTAPEFSVVIESSFIMGLIFISLTLPITFKYGFAKARYLFIAMIILPIIIINIVSQTINSDNLSNIITIITNNDILLSIILYVILATIFLISILCSIRIYSKKELTN